jgi:hypothetical protein
MVVVVVVWSLVLWWITESESESEKEANVARSRSNWVEEWWTSFQGFGGGEGGEAVSGGG